MKPCPHDREQRFCVRCDPWTPRDAADEQINEWQRWIDEERARKADLRATVEGWIKSRRVRVGP